jgi:23S rRNA (guanosine2251-2'-O)-methyltransferase
VIEALKAGTAIQQVVLLQGVRGRVIDDIRQLADGAQVRVVEYTKQQFRALTANATTQGVIALLPARKLGDLDDLLAGIRARQESGFLLLLDQIEDPHNLGALVRTAECAGAQGVIIPKHHQAPLSSTVSKTSAGASELMPMAEVGNVVGAIERLKQEGYWIVGLSADGEKLYTDVDYTVPVVLVVGNEGRGIRRLVKEHCDHLVKIPLFGNIASLNASVAGALGMYEVVRQRGSKQRSFV